MDLEGPSIGNILVALHSCNVRARGGQIFCHDLLKSVIVVKIGGLLQVSRSLG